MTIENLTLEEAQLILNALANMPFIQVNALIARLKADFERQLQSKDESE